MSKRANIENETNSEEDIRSKIKASNKRRLAAEKLLINYEMEAVIQDRIEKKKKEMEKLIFLTNDVENLTEIIEHDGVFVQGLEVSVATHIKQNAVKRHRVYQQLDPNKQAIVCLGLNSIIDLSASYPERQSTLFSKQQWRELQHLFPKKFFNICPYDNLQIILKPFFEAYKDIYTNKKNWSAMYSQVLGMQNKLIVESIESTESAESYRDVDFCLTFFKSLLLICKNHVYLFDEDVDNSEWDHVVKFWGPLMEQLFAGSDLRLSWCDTVLTMKDVCGNNRLRTSSNYSMDQKSNSDVMETPDGDPSAFKYIFDRCQLLCESKDIIDNFLLNSQSSDTIYSIQFCGLEMIIMSLSLPVNGLYVGKEIYRIQLENRLDQFPSYLETVMQLLCFRDDALKVNQACDNIISASTSKNTFKSYSASNLDHNTESPKFFWKRGDWIPPRRKDAPVPAIPDNLTS